MENLGEDLRQAPLFAALSKKEIELLAQTAVRSGLSRKETVFTPGAPLDALYLIVHGGIKISKTNGHQAGFIIEIYQPGEVIGEECLARLGAHDTEARPLENATLIKLDLKTVNKLMAENPRFTRACLELAVERARAFREKAEELIFKEVEVRLGLALLKLTRAFGRRDKQGTLIATRITHQDLADYIGASRETVSLALGALRKKKLLKMNVRKFIVPDLKALKKSIDGE